jgi:hypothetical protein
MVGYPIDTSNLRSGTMIGGRPGSITSALECHKWSMRKDQSGTLREVNAN